MLIYISWFQDFDTDLIIHPNTQNIPFKLDNIVKTQRREALNSEPVS